MTPLRFALIGPGGAADRHLAPALRAVHGAELRCVVGRDLAKATAFAGKHGATADVPAWDDVGKMLFETDAEAVIIAAPDALHAPLAIQAAAYGKHVFVEKPMATSTEDARAMIEACTKAGVTLGVGYHQRWNPLHRKVRKKALPLPALGPIRRVSLRWTKSVENADDWRTGSLGRWWSLGAYGTHVLDLATWMLEPHCGRLASMRSLFSRGRLQAKADEAAEVIMRFQDGTIAELFVSMVHPRERSIEIECERGTLVLRDTLGPGGGWIEEAGGIRIHQQAVDPYAAEVADFVAAVREGRPPEVDGQAGYDNVYLLEWAEASNCW